jgi:hypothetical protein
MMDDEIDKIIIKKRPKKTGVNFNQSLKTITRCMIHD